MADEAPKIVTPEATLMWAYLFKPKPARARPGAAAGDPKYVCDLVFSPAAVASAEFQAMKEVAAKVATEKFGPRLQGLIESEKFISPFWKNERKKDPETGKLPPGYEPGGMYITIKSNLRPALVYNSGAGGIQPIIDENDLYPGCKVRASVDCYAYDNESRGVSFGLRGILKVGEGERLGGGGIDAKAEFAAFAAPPAAAAGGTAAASALFG